MASKDPRDASRRVQFEEAGEGTCLLLRNAAARELFNRFGRDYFQVIEKGLQIGDFEVVDFLLERMVWKGDEPVKISMDDLDHVPLQSVLDKMLDAFSLSANGRTYKEQVVWLIEEQKRQRKMLEGENPTTAPAAMSGTLAGSAPAEG